MELIKATHVLCAYLTGAGFLLRGLLAIMQHPALQHRSLKVAPHIIDTLLFASGLIMVITWSLWPTSQPWLIAKLVALLIYIGFGFLMLRWGATPGRRWVGLLGGLATYAYIVGVAHSKSPLSLLIFNA